MAKLNIEKLNKLKRKEWRAFIIFTIVLVLLLIITLTLHLLNKKNNPKTNPEITTTNPESENNSNTKLAKASKIFLYIFLAYTIGGIIGTYIYLVIRKKWLNGYLRT